MEAGPSGVRPTLGRGVLNPDDPTPVADDATLVVDDPTLVVHDPTRVVEDTGGLARRHEAVRRRRMAEVFGDVLPDSTRDDVDDETPAERGRTRSRDEEMLRDVPPHHG